MTLIGEALTQILCPIIGVHEGEGFPLPPGVLSSRLDDGLTDRLNLLLAQNLQDKRLIKRSDITKTPTGS